VVICLERGADLHMVQLMPLPLAVSCFGKIQIGFTFLVPARPGSPGQMAVKRVCDCIVLMYSAVQLKVCSISLLTYFFTYSYVKIQVARASCSHTRLCHQAVLFGSGQGAVMPCGWEGNRGSGVALAMRHRLQ